MARIYFIRNSTFVKKAIVYTKGALYPPPLLDHFEKVFAPYIEKKIRIRIRNADKIIKKYFCEYMNNPSVYEVPEISPLDNAMRNHYFSSVYALNLSHFPSICCFPSAKQAYENLAHMVKEIKDKNIDISTNPFLLSRVAEQFAETFISFHDALYTNGFHKNRYNYASYIKFKIPIIMYLQLLLTSANPQIHVSTGFISEVALLIARLLPDFFDINTLFISTGIIHDKFFTHNSRLNHYVIEQSIKMYEELDHISSSDMQKHMDSIERYLYSSLFFTKDLYFMMPRFKVAQNMLRYFMKHIGNKNVS